jgi:hypothetical protein
MCSKTGRGDCVLGVFVQADSSDIGNRDVEIKIIELMAGALQSPLEMNKQAKL